MKGIAIHHAGMMPILREMVEFLFEKKYIKVLFATETFAVGVNMPAKTVIFSNIQKYTEKGFRHLLSHEYTQMAGRAGRRGLDNIGIVIHMLNLFNELPQSYEYRFLLDGRPQQLISKFKPAKKCVKRYINGRSKGGFYKIGGNDWPYAVGLPIQSWKVNDKDIHKRFLKDREG